MFEAILAALLAFQPHSTDTTETADARRARLKVVAGAIEGAARATESYVPAAEMAAALLALGWHESGYASRVQLGECHAMPPDQRCDGGRARGPWQAWRVSCPVLWDLEQGSLEAVEAGAECAARYLAGAKTRCRSEATDEWAGAFSGYAGARCWWSGGVAREATRQRLLPLLDRTEPAS